MRDFKITYPGGDYVKFTGSLNEQFQYLGDGMGIKAQITDMKIVEQGNCMVGNAADECPQESI